MEVFDVGGFGIVLNGKLLNLLKTTLSFSLLVDYYYFEGMEWILMVFIIETAECYFNHIIIYYFISLCI